MSCCGWPFKTKMQYILFICVTWEKLCRAMGTLVTLTGTNQLIATSAFKPEVTPIIYSTTAPLRIRWQADVKWNSQLWDFLLLPYKKKAQNLFCAWGRSVQFCTCCTDPLAPVLLVTHLRGRPATVHPSLCPLGLGAGKKNQKKQWAAILSICLQRQWGRLQVGNEFILWTTGFTESHLLYGIASKFNVCFFLVKMLNAQFVDVLFMWTNL